MEINMKESFLMANIKAREFSNGHMEINMKDSGSMTKFTE